MWKNLRRLHRYEWKYRFSAIFFIIFLILFSVFEYIQPYFYKLFIDTVENGQTQLLPLILGIFIGSKVLQLIFEFICRTIYDRFNFKAAKDARVEIVSRIHDLDFAYHLSKSTGAMISAVKRGDSAFINISHTVDMQLSRVIIGFVVMLGIFTTVQPQLIPIMLLTVVVSLSSSYYLVKQNIKSRKEHNEAEDEISSIITDNLINFDTVKLFAKEKFERARLEHGFVKWFKTLWSYANSFRAIETVVGTISAVSLLIVLLISLQNLEQDRLTAGDIALIIGFSTQFYQRLFDMVWRMRDLAKGFTDLEKYFAILDESVHIKDPVKPVKLQAVKGDVEFNSITFKYPETKDPVLQDFTLQIKQGQSIALVGRSGQGKSTIIKLLMRFYDVQKGEILVDGINIKKITKSDLRAHVGVVPQEPILFNNTIAYNIGYGADQPTHEQVKAAAKMAFLDAFIEGLPNKYETNVGERGIKLSGGQKQRLAIARMILANPDIIVFDEATSHLDSESEKAIQDAFWNAVKGKTAIVVAHRLSTIVKADVIVVMQDGKIAEKGSHRALLQKQNGIYRHFWELQTDIT